MCACCASTSPLPFIFLTNGGGVPEQAKAAQLSSWFDLCIPASLVCCSHTPMQSLLPQYAHSRLLVLGMTDVRAVARGYGFTDVVTAADLFRAQPQLVPHLIHEDEGGGSVNKQQAHTEAREGDAPSIDLASVDLVVCMHDPVHWYRDIQLTLDVVTARPTPPPLYFTNPDFLFSGRSAAPRLAQGAFRTALDAIHRQYTGRTLSYQLMGKPELITFRWAERMQQARADAMGLGRVERRYMIGDNTAADVRGANRAGWTSVFVRTGTIARGEAEDERPSVVCADVGEAVEWIVEQERKAQSGQHLANNDGVHAKAAKTRHVP